MKSPIKQPALLIFTCSDYLYLQAISLAIPCYGILRSIKRAPFVPEMHKPYIPPPVVSVKATILLLSRTSLHLPEPKSKL